MNNPRKMFNAIVISLILSGVAGGYMKAQDEAATPSPEVTEVAPVLVAPTAEATVEPVPTPAPEQPVAPSDRAIYVIGFIVFALFSLAINFAQNRNVNALIEGLKSALDNKQLQDEARERYTQSSLSTQEVIKFLESTLRLVSLANIPVIDPVVDKLAEFGDKVTSTTPSAN